MGVWTHRLFWLLLASTSAAVPAQETAPESTPASGERLPEEITVTGQKLFSTLNRQIREAEVAMYGLFNELNTDDLYDIHCRWDAPLGTRIRAHSCSPQFLSRANEENAEGFLAMTRGEAGGNPVPVQAQLDFHYPILETKMKELVRSNPELFDAIMQLNSLREALEARKSNFFDED